jgi:aspartyl-tRNA(Asn)/glutamyl-tRNA(Gln) amidotransferase subunit A
MNAGQAPLRFADANVDAGVAALRERYASGACNAVDATRGYLERIARHNPGLNAFVDLDPEVALPAAEASAARWARGAPLSSIDGVPIGIKANIAVRGLPWTGGLAARRGLIATEDAPCVARLRAAGAVLLGNLNMDEAALGATGHNPWYGRTRNPHRPGHSTGGSSAGAGAAVAAGLCAAALGTDTMGSVRIPAALCGVVGHSPVQGTIDGRGVLPLSWTYDNVGVLARSLADAECLLDAASGAPGKLAEAGDSVESNGYAEPRDCAEPGGPAGHDVAVLMLPDGIALDPEAQEAFESASSAARDAGLRLHPLHLDDVDLQRASKALLLVVEAEAWVQHEALLREQPGSVSAPLRSLLEWGARQSAARLASAYHALREWRGAIRAQLAPWAGLLAPVMPCAGFAFDEPPPQLAAFTIIGSIAGLSGLSLPLALHTHASPGALQILSTRNDTTHTLARRIAGALPAVGAPARYLS